MKGLLAVLVITGGLALTFVVAGCNRGAEEAQTPPATTAPAAEATLGTAQTGGPFQVTLNAVPEEPKEGEMRFIATVTRDGKPVEDAEVELALSMPTMNMGGPTVELNHREEGRYEGEADLSMGGAWQAVVTVKDEGETGTATYTFTAVQK